MTTKREQIMAAVAATLAPTAGVSGRVYRSRTQALRSQELPALLLESQAASHEYPNLSTVDSVMQFRVSIFARADIPEQSVDASVASAYSLLMADRDIGGLAQDLWMVGSDYPVQEGDNNIGGVTMTFAAKYRTTANSLEA